MKNAARNAGSCIVLASMLIATEASDAADSPGAAYRRGDYAQAIRLLKPQAEDGRADAQIMLGQMYLKGEGVPTDVAQGIAWITKAANEGTSIAAYDLGVFCSMGVGGPKDNQCAAAWYRKAAHQGYPEAAFNLAVLYHAGQGVERNDAMALNWINAARAYLPSNAAPELRSRYRVLQDSILAVMPPEQVNAASRLVSPDGPVIGARILNKDALVKKGLKDYPLDLRELQRGGKVVTLLLVHADGTVGDATIEASCGYPKIDAVTLRLLAEAEAVPRRVDGQPTESWQIFTFYWVVRVER